MLMLVAKATCCITVNWTFTRAVGAKNLAVPCGRVNSVHVLANHGVLGEDWAVLVRALDPFGFKHNMLVHLRGASMRF